MKNLFTTLVFSLSYLIVNAQQDRFLYLQSENKQPFFVKFDSKVYNSNSFGYIIIPKLSDGLYSLILGFPETTLEQEFNCQINKKDLGFIIKKSGPDQVQLLNVQTLKNIVPANVISKPVTIYEKETDLFSTMLANAVHDSTILIKEQKSMLPEAVTGQKDTNTIAIKPEAEFVKSENTFFKDTAKKEMVPVVKVDITDGKDTALGSANDNVIFKPNNVSHLDSAVNKGISIEEPDIAQSVIKRKVRKVSKEGIEMMYIDTYGEVKDTIRILIPVDKKTDIKQEKISKPVVSVPSEATNSQIENLNDNKILEDKRINGADNKNILKSAMINSDCKSFATDEDFLKVRKKMVAEDNTDDMIKVAKKVFKSKCFTTDQVKNLSVLFLQDQDKYVFFDTAYPFVSDSDQYPVLEKQLSNNYYITRFRAMIHK